MALVRHQPDQPEAGPAGDGPGQLGQLGGGAQRRAQGPDPDPAAEHAQRGVQLQTDPDLLRAPGPRRVDEFQLCVVVHHHGHGGGPLRVPGQFREGRAVGRRIGQQDVLETGPRQPQRLREREGHDPGESGTGQHPLQQGAAAHRFARHPDGLPGRTPDEVVGVGVERLQIDDGDRGVEMGGGPVVAGPVSGAGSHGRSLPDSCTAG